jgi:hypothetical protein
MTEPADFRARKCVRPDGATDLDEVVVILEQWSPTRRRASKPRQRRHKRTASRRSRVSGATRPRPRCWSARNERLPGPPWRMHSGTCLSIHNNSTDIGHLELGLKSLDKPRCEITVGYAPFISDERDTPVPPAACPQEAETSIGRRWVFTNRPWWSARQRLYVTSAVTGSVSSNGLLSPSSRALWFCRVRVEECLEVRCPTRSAPISSRPAAARSRRWPLTDVAKPSHRRMLRKPPGSSRTDAVADLLRQDPQAD